MHGLGVNDEYSTITLSPWHDLDLGGGAGSAVIAVTANIEWTAYSNDTSWLTITNVKSNSFTISAKENTQAPTRQTIVRVIGKVGNNEVFNRSIIVKQIENFSYSSNKLDNKLALRCAKYAALAYQGFEYNYSTDTFTEKSVSRTALPAALRSELQREGFGNIQSSFGSASTYGDDNPHNVSFTLAHKKVSYSGATGNLVVVVIRGTDTDEWKGNMDVTDTAFSPNMPNHYSFEQARDAVRTELHKYIANIFGSISNADPLVLITGHSRGAAVANLLAYYLNSNPLTPGGAYIGVTNIFAYAFATVNNTRTPSPSPNIFNFCFDDDFVPQSPLKEWGYGKHGNLYLANAYNLYKTDGVFKNEMDAFVKRSYDRRNSADFSRNATADLMTHVKGWWSSTEQYYAKRWYGLVYEISLYTFFREIVAPAAMQEALPIVTMASVASNLSDHIFGPIARYFVVGNAVFKYVNDTHISYTYYLALKQNAFVEESLYSASSSSNRSLETLGMMSVGIQRPANPNQAEVQKLINFTQQFNNLENLGWDLRDFSTWAGVLWTDDTENRVCSIDIKYSELSGKLDLSGFTALEYLNIAGNFIDEINLTDCDSLIELNCFNNLLKSLTAPSAEIINCGFNQLTGLNVNFAANLKELYCGGNALTALNLSNNTALIEFDCGDNNLSELDLSANTALTTLRCERNCLDIQECSTLWAQIQTIGNRFGALLSYECQKR